MRHSGTSSSLHTKTFAKGRRTFSVRLHDEVKRRVNLPAYSWEGTEPAGEWFDPLPCAQIAYSILTRDGQANYYLKEHPPRISQTIPKEIHWPEGTTIGKINDETKCALIKQAVEDLTTEPRMVLDINKLIQNGQEISESLSRFKYLFLDHSRNVINLGGTLDGECEYCSKLKLK